MIDDEVTFLGTGGARVVVSTQFRATGGILFYLQKKLILIDPGPGSLIRFHQFGNNYRINKLDAIILTHRHLDHSADINVIIDSLTEGGKKKRGILFAPVDAIDDDPVVLKFYQNSIRKINRIMPGNEYLLGNVKLIFPIRHHHGVETYGIVFKLPDYSIGYITDTDYFDELKEAYKCDILIINVLRPEPIEFPHLSVPEARRIIESISPKLAIITHFGMMMIKKNPLRVARDLSAQTKVKVIAAEDGLKVRPIHYLNGQNN